jgi:predicted secreted protein
MPRIRETIAAGHNNKGNFAGTDIDLQEWTISVGGDDADITDSSTAGIKRSMTVNDEYTISATGLWKYAQQPTDSAPGIKRGTVATLNIYVSSEKYIGGTVEVKTFEIVSVNNDAVKFTFTAEYDAEPSWPSASLFSSSSSSSSST